MQNHKIIYLFPSNVQHPEWGPTKKLRAVTPFGNASPEEKWGQSLVPANKISNKNSWSN